MVAEFGKDLGERLPGVLARGDGGEFDVGMREEQAHKFLAGITGGANNSNFDGFVHLKSANALTTHESGKKGMEKFTDFRVLIFCVRK